MFPGFGKMQLSSEYTADIEHRFKYASALIGVLFLVVLSRLYFLQVMKGDYFHFFSTENSIKEIKIPAERGMIFDRRGQILVDNRPSFNVVLVPQYVIDPERTLDSLSRLLQMPREELDMVWAKRTTLPKYQPLVVKPDVLLDEVSLIRTRKNPWFDPKDDFDLRGVDIEIRYERSYPESNIATHLLGYIKEVDPDRLKKLEKDHPSSYKPGDFVGIGGVEETWDQYVRGQDGFEQKIVNAVGREVDYAGIASELEHRQPVPGNSLRLTIDRDLQEVAREMFGTRKGAAVAIDVKTGGILAMYSSPSYDLNRLSGPYGGDYWKLISNHPDKYVLNRAIQGGYPPGSTYKILNAVAALSEGVVKEDETVSCGGALVYGGRPYHCWAKGGHGPISLHRAIVSSCDVYFYHMGLRLGVDRLAKYANIFSMGKKTGVPLPNEKPGLIPTSQWKLERFKVPWQKGEDLSIAIGQGYDVVTPIQNALLAAEVSNGGWKLDLHIVNSAYSVEGESVFEWQAPKERVSLGLDPKILAAVKSGMAGVVSEGGTAHRLSSYKAKMGGKTGTAQVYQLDSGVKCVSEKCKDHAWFIGFSEVEDTQIAAAVIVENGGFGAAAAAPIVGAMLQKYYDIEHGITGAEEDDEENKKKEKL